MGVTTDKGCYCWLVQQVGFMYPVHTAERVSSGGPDLPKDLCSSVPIRGEEILLSVSSVISVAIPNLKAQRKTQHGLELLPLAHFVNHVDKGPRVVDRCLLHHAVTEVEDMPWPAGSLVEDILRTTAKFHGVG